MKVAMDQYGNMTLHGDTEAELYAIRKWWEDWQSGKVCLSVAVPCPTTGTQVDRAILPPEGK